MTYLVAVFCVVVAMITVFVVIELRKPRASLTSRQVGSLTAGQTGNFGAQQRTRFRRAIVLAVQLVERHLSYDTTEQRLSQWLDEVVSASADEAALLESVAVIFIAAEAEQQLALTLDEQLASSLKTWLDDHLGRS